VDGFSVSSLFEAVLARNILQDARIQLISPIIRERELDEIISLCGRITVNSFRQARTVLTRGVDSVDLGIRLNPKIKCVEDERYDPCRRNSKLGVSLQALVECIKREPNNLSHVSGLHFHTNCDSSDLRQLAATIRVVGTVLASQRGRFRWLNIGGGYTLEDEQPRAAVEALAELADRQELEILMEPGAAFVRSAGYFVGTVVDLLNGDDLRVAVLDLSVNHWPEVFEYQFEPDVVGHVDDGRYTYQFAGCSCLPGDLFGTYSFDEPMEIGSRVVFANAGAYSLVKAHLFNGINLPDIYALTENGELVLKKSFTYEDFASRWGVETRASV
jgi:carboxynorspermidine decarboxylase